MSAVGIDDDKQKLLMSNARNLLYENSERTFILPSEKLVSLELRDSFLIISSSESLDSTKICAADIVGTKVTEKVSQDKTRNYILNIYYYPCCEFTCINTGSHRQRRHAAILFKYSHADICQNWADAINSQIFGSLITGLAKQRSFLVFVNPVSGNGSAVAIWDSIVSIMLKDAGINVTLVLTERQGHAKEYVATTDLTSFCVILSVGGDGLFSEVVQGITSRQDSIEIFQQVGLAPIPGGSGNGLVKSILFECNETYSVESATFVALKGTNRHMDLSLYQTKNGNYHSFLSLAWGLVSDIDIQSEPIRWMGETRFALAGLYFIAKRMVYKGCLSFIPACSQTKNSNLSSSASHSVNIELPLLSEPFTFLSVEHDVQVISGEFLLVWVVQTSHATAHMHSGPGVQLDDGFFTIFVVRDMNRFELLQLFLAIDNGNHVSNPKVEKFIAYAFRLEPEGDHGLFSYI